MLARISKLIHVPVAIKNQTARSKLDEQRGGGATSLKKPMKPALVPLPMNRTPEGHGQLLATSISLKAMRQAREAQLRKHPLRGGKGVPPVKIVKLLMEVPSIYKIIEEASQEARRKENRHLLLRSPERGVGNVIRPKRDLGGGILRKQMKCEALLGKAASAEGTSN